MTTTAWLAIVFGMWGGFGIALAIAMSLKGHSGFTWLVIGATFGPFAVPIAVAARVWDRDVRPVVVASGLNERGRVDVLIGADGSPESRAAAEHCVVLLAPIIGRSAVAMVADLDAGQARSGAAFDAAKTTAASVAAMLDPIKPAEVVLFGRPDEALSNYAASEGFGMIVIGSRGAGRTQALLGSTAARLAKGVGVPVLTFGDELAADVAGAEGDEGAVHAVARVP